MEGFQRERYLNELNTPLNERDPKVMQVWNCTIKYDLKELTGTTYTNKMHLLFSIPSLKNSTVACLAWSNYGMSDLYTNYTLQLYVCRDLMTLFAHQCFDKHMSIFLGQVHATLHDYNELLQLVASIQLRLRRNLRNATPSLWCFHYHCDNHIIDKCWKLHDKPPCPANVA